MTRSIGPLFVLVLPVVALLPAGCATSFHGSAHFPGGPAGCEARCVREHMRMVQYVYVGEYSSACVCELDPARMAGATAPAPGASASSSVIAATAGVMTQMRDSQQQQQVSR